MSLSNTESLMRMLSFSDLSNSPIYQEESFRLLLCLTPLTGAVFTFLQSKKNLQAKMPSWNFMTLLCIIEVLF